MIDKEKAQELLDELPGLGPPELADWNIRAQTFLVFQAIGIELTRSTAEARELAMEAHGR